MILTDRIERKETNRNEVHQIVSAKVHQSRMHVIAKSRKLTILNDYETVLRLSALMRNTASMDRQSMRRELFSKEFGGAKRCLKISLSTNW